MFEHDHFRKAGFHFRDHAFSHRARRQGFLVPQQQPPAHQAHAFHQQIADHGDLHDAREDAAGIGETRCSAHGTAKAVAAHEHLADDRDDQRDRHGDLQSCEDLRQRRRQGDLPEELALACPHVARRPDQLALDAADADNGRRHHRKDHLHSDHGDLGHIVHAEPENDDRQERDLRHREADRDDGIEEPVGDGIACDRHAEHDAGNAPDQEARQRPVERDHRIGGEVAGEKVGPDALEHRGERGQHEWRERTRARRDLPRDRQRDDRAHMREPPADAGEPARHGSWRVSARRRVGLPGYLCHRSALCMSRR